MLDICRESFLAQKRVDCDLDFVMQLKVIVQVKC